MSNKHKEARVVHVMDGETVILNVGTQDGVEKGSRYLVYEIGDEMFDPETGENLGHLEIVKGLGEVTHVQERMCTLSSANRKEDTQSKRIIKRRGGMAILGRLPEVEEILEQPRIYILDFEPEVKIGDFAKPI